MPEVSSGARIIRHHFSFVYSGFRVNAQVADVFKK